MKSARDISYSTFLIFGIGSALWLVYGVHFGAVPVVAANAITAILSFAIFVLAIAYERRDLPQSGLYATNPTARPSKGTAR